MEQVRESHACLFTENERLREQLAAEQKHSAFCTKMANERLEETVVLKRQIAMDTECIERIRNHGMKMEAERDQLAAEQSKVQKLERTLEAAYENHREDIAKREADYTRELNQKLAQILAQSEAIIELRAICNARYCGNCDLSYKDDDCTCGNYEKIGSYPLPDGRTK